MSLTSTHVPHQNDVLLPAQVFSFSQFQYPGAVDRRDGGELKLVQGPEVRKPGLGNAPLLLVLLPLGHFQFQETEQVVLVGAVLLGCFLGQPLILAYHGRQFQAFQVVLDEQILGHQLHLPKSRSYWRKSRSCTEGPAGGLVSGAGGGPPVVPWPVFRKKATVSLLRLLAARAFSPL